MPGHHPADSGGVTRDGTVTVVGKTTPNSIVFIDGPTTSTRTQSTGNFKFEGGALATDSQGFFYYTVTLAKVSRGGSILGANFLIRTPFKPAGHPLVPDPQAGLNPRRPQPIHRAGDSGDVLNPVRLRRWCQVWRAWPRALVRSAQALESSSSVDSTGWPSAEATRALVRSAR